MIYDLLVAPFADFGFMRRALIACLALSLAGSAIGVFLILRRMSLMGDALAHSLLPGAALGFVLGGLSLPAMSLGGFIAGITTALVSGAIARFSAMREDASFAAAYLTSLALGVLIVSLRGSAVDLMDLIRRWRSENRTVIAVLHDLDQVRREFPNSLLLARELVDAGPTSRVLSADNLLRARAMAEAWDEQAGACEVPLRLSA